MTNKNLSEQLFKPSFNYPETSMLTKRVPEFGYQINSFEHPTRWYRDLTKAMWLWQGISYLDISDALSCIAISHHNRTSEQLLDTVIGYGRGNWVYEWSKQAMNWQQKALAVDESDALFAGQCWLSSANLYSVAGYPHLQGDLLSEQAEVLANKAYEQAFAKLPYDHKIIEFNVEGGKLTGMLHLPDISKGPYPTVLLCGNLSQLQGDYYQLFYRYLAPAGFAMLCIDPPSVGYSAKWKLSYDCSKLHQQVLRQINGVPWIDDRRVFAMGFLFGANIAVRLAYLEPTRLRGVVSLDGLVHHVMADTKAHQGIPNMYKDILANRMGLCRVSDPLLEAEIKRYSLKVQGLLGHRCNTPVLAIALSNGLYGTTSDAKLIASSSLKGKLIQHARMPWQHYIDVSLKQAIEWVDKQMNG